MRTQFTRRRALAFAGAGSLALAAPAVAQAPWPAKPVRFVVPFPPGQAADIFARLMAEKLTDVWKQQVIVENKGGGSGIPATESVKIAPPDGYSLMVVSSGAHTSNLSLYKKLPYDVVNDFLPVTQIGESGGYFVLVAPTLGVNTITELVALAKAKPLSYGSPPAGNTLHLATEMFKQRTGVDATHIPYKSIGQSYPDLMSNKVQFAFSSIAGALPL